MHTLSPNDLEQLDIHLEMEKERAHALALQSEYWAMLDGTLNADYGEDDPHG